MHKAGILTVIWYLLVPGTTANASAMGRAYGNRGRIPFASVDDAQFANEGVKIQLEGLEQIQSKERKMVVKDYIALLIDAQRAVVLVAKEYQSKVLSEDASEEGRETNRQGSRLQVRWVGTVWVARTGAWEDKTQEAAALLARTLQDLQGGHETADSDIDGPSRLSSGKSRCAHFGFNPIQDGANQPGRPDRSARHGHRTR